MEPSRLNLGMSNLAGRTIGFARYAADGSYTTLLYVDQSGNLFTTGVVNPPSDVAQKTGFADLAVRDVLQRVVSLPVRSWVYRSAPEQRHIGPTAQDFRAAFALGVDEKHIATVDADGVALAAIQGLHQVVQEKDREIGKLKRDVAQLKLLVKALAAKSR